MSTHSLFCYGTLMWPEIFASIAGPSPTPTPARLEGYQCRILKNAVYPGLSAAGAEHSVSGVIYRPLRAEQLRRLDRYEGVQYRRQQVPVLCNGEPILCWLYVPRRRYQYLLGRPWSAQHFARHHLQAYRRRIAINGRACRGQPT